MREEEKKKGERKEGWKKTEGNDIYRWLWPSHRPVAEKNFYRRQKKKKKSSCWSCANPDMD